jgi:hypothetical protein
LNKSANAGKITWADEVLATLKNKKLDYSLNCGKNLNYFGAGVMDGTTRSSDFLIQAFDCLPDKDYMILTQPHSYFENSLLDNFKIIYFMKYF